MRIISWILFVVREDDGARASRRVSGVSRHIQVARSTTVYTTSLSGPPVSCDWSTASHSAGPRYRLPTPAAAGTPVRWPSHSGRSWYRLRHRQISRPKCQEPPAGQDLYCSDFACKHSTQSRNGTVLLHGLQMTQCRHAQTILKQAMIVHYE